MVLKNIEQAQKLFPDAVKLQLRINKEMSAKDVRRLLPNSVVLLSCKLSKNYANVIYSEGAAKSLFPDITMMQRQVSLSNVKQAYVYCDRKNGSVKLLVDFLPQSDKMFIERIEQAFGKNLVRISNYPEADMGCFFFERIHPDDLIKVLTLCKEDGEIH